MTPLGSLVNIKRVSGPEYTNRFNLYRSIQINGSPARVTVPDRPWPRWKKLQPKCCPAVWAMHGATCHIRKRRPPEVKLAVFGMSLVFVFLILAALYESWSLPFSVLFPRRSRCLARLAD